MTFVNRRTELSQLQAWWDRSEPRAALVWGRRRVGKTALLQHFAADRRTVFHLGTGRAEAGELAELSRNVQAALPTGTRDLATSPFSRWEEALDHLATIARDEPLLLVLDEFPEMMSRSPELPGILRAFLDLSRGKTRLRLLLCGSAMRTMQAIQEYRAPLYGRFDLSMQVHPFRPHEASELLPDLEPSARAMVYGIFGGMPLYLSWWDSSMSTTDNITALAGGPNSPMIVEGDYILATETRGGELFSDILRSISEGRTKHNEIADAVATDPSRALRDLQQLRLIEKVYPVTETQRSRRRIYQLTDNFLRFHLGVLARYRGQIDRGLGETVVPMIVEGIDDHMGPPWEEAFRDHLRRRAAEIHPHTVAVGPWWQKGGQDEIDAVVLAGRSNAPVLAGEAKWARTINGPRVLARLMAKAAALGGGDDLRYALCARESVSGVEDGTMVVTAEDVFG